MAKLADLIWKNAELLRGAFKENEYRKVILPFTILRRLDCVLAPSRDAVLKKYGAVRSGGYDLDKMLTPTSGYPFFNISKFTLPKVAETPDDVRDNLEAMVNGFSQNVRDIFEKFGFIATIDKLAEKNRLFLVVQRFAETDLNPGQVTNHDMGQAFEELLRKFNDASPAGEQYTPRDVIELMVTLLFSGDDDVLSVPGVVRTMYDPTAGTGGILSVAEEYLKRLNSRATLKLFGQERRHAGHRQTPRQDLRVPSGQPALRRGVEACRSFGAQGAQQGCCRSVSARPACHPRRADAVLAAPAVEDAAGGARGRKSKGRRPHLRTADVAGQHPQAVRARYDRRTGRVVVGLSSGLEITFKPHDAPGLQNASPEQLADIEISPSGQGLHFSQIDADLYLPALLQSLSRQS